VGNEILTADDKTLFSRPFATLTQAAKLAKRCSLFLFLFPFQHFPWRSLRLCERRFVQYRFFRATHSKQRGAFLVVLRLFSVMLVSKEDNV
jgi:hypothetical protein